MLTIRTGRALCALIVPTIAVAQVFAQWMLYRSRMRYHYNIPPESLVGSDLVVFYVPLAFGVLLNYLSLKSLGRVAYPMLCAAIIAFMSFSAGMVVGLNLYGS